RAISGLASNRSFGLWTTAHGGDRLGGRCHLIAETRVCRRGHRLAWRVHGLVLWLQPAASPYSTPPVRPGLPPVTALRSLADASRRVPLAAAQGGHSCPALPAMRQLSRRPSRHPAPNRGIEVADQGKKPAIRPHDLPGSAPRSVVGPAAARVRPPALLRA